MLEIAFFYDPRLVDFWDQIIRTFAVARAHVMDLPADYQTDIWRSCSSLHALPTPRIMFSPPDAVELPGQIALHDFEHPADALYVFGSDDMHNEAIESSAVVYVPTPRKAPLWSVQAAAVVLHDRWVRGDP
jgi:hypothetical protein